MRMLWLLGISTLLLAVSQSQAQTAFGFFDQGFTQTPVVRTDFYSSTAGTSVNPLQISGCHFGQNPCPPASPSGGPGTVRTVFPQSNYWTQNWPANCVPGFSCPPHNWILIMNNEPRDDAGNLGPPDASLPRYEPGAGGVMGFVTVHGSDNFPGDTYWRAHIVLNAYVSNPVLGGLPYLGFGAFANHGNGAPIGSLNNSSAPHILKFDSRLWGSTLPQPCCGPGTTQLQTITSWLTIIASWGTHPKMIQIALFHQAHDPQHPSIPDPYLGGPSPQNSRVKWDWRYTQSGFYPGAEYITLKADDLNTYCGLNVPTLVLNQDVHFSINVQTLYTCMNNHNLFLEPLPATANLPVNTVLWANESSGINGYLWTDVHNMRMDATAGAPQAVDEPQTSEYADGEPQYGFETDAIRRSLELDAEWAGSGRAH